MQPSGSIVEINVVVRSNEVSVDEATEILQAARKHCPDVKVDLILYHVNKRLLVPLWNTSGKAGRKNE